ncbi:MAG: flagellar hook basal-body protein [Planctomycetota bacterium]
MDKGLHHSVAALRSGERQLEAITQNLANVSTRGFKRGTSFAHAVASARASEPTVVAGLAPDLSQGPLETTGNPLDLALEGPGWFVVEAEAGRSYTRDGSFRVDDRGSLVTQDGQPVAWKGSRASLRPAGEAVIVDAEGQVRQGQTTVGQLDIVDLDPPAKLLPASGGRWRAPEGTQEIPAKAQVRQGSLESSNVEPMDELVALVTVQRGFESAATLMRTIEQSYRRLNQPR